MFSKLLKPFTTSTSAGVATRDLVQLVAATVAVLGILGVLTDEQAKALTEQAPVLMASLGAVAWTAMSIYRTLTKSHSNKAAEVAREVDAKLPASATVVVKTPSGQQEIVVHNK